jgi:Holliday junction resolvase
MRRRITRDGNHLEIVKRLREHGVQVLDLATSGDGTPDVLAYYRGRTMFIEIKAMEKAAVKRSQIKFFSEWQGDCGLVQTLDEALILVKGHKSAFTQAERDRMAFWLMKNPKVETLHVPSFWIMVGRVPNPTQLTVKEVKTKCDHCKQEKPSLPLWSDESWNVCADCYPIYKTNYKTVLSRASKELTEALYPNSKTATPETCDHKQQVCSDCYDKVWE